MARTRFLAGLPILSGFWQSGHVLVLIGKAVSPGALQAACLLQYDTCLVEQPRSEKAEET